MHTGDSFHFLFFGLSSFRSLPHREQGIAIECARLGHRVDFIEIAPSVAGKSLAAFHRIRAPLSRDTGFHSHVAIPNLRIHTPPMLPTGLRNSLTPSVDRALFQRWFRATFDSTDIAHAIVMVMMPLWWGNFIDHDLLQPRLLVYDICDALEVPAHSDASLRRLRNSERALVSHADLITYSAAEMIEDIERQHSRRDAMFLPNAVARDFIDAFDREPIHVRKNRPPTIGFIGSTSGKWFDAALVLETARACPDFEFSVIGPVDRRFANACVHHRNITLHGYIPHEQLPGHLRRFDAAVIPFLDNEITRVVNPLKMYEYSAAGIPVIARRTRELEHHASLLYLADDREGFVASIHRALTEDNPPRRQARRQFANQNTWEVRVRDLIAHLHTQVLAA